jgi:hypothetical protein
MSTVVRGCLAIVVTFSLSTISTAQESTSAVVAKQLTAALDAAKLDAISAKDPARPDAFVGALYFPGGQLLVVGAQYAAPTLLNEKIGRKDYRDVYLDLSSASIPESKVFVEDYGSNGLKPRRDGAAPPDTYEAAGKRTVFDGDWKKQKLSEGEYLTTFSTADGRYREMLSALLAQVQHPY